MCIPTWRFRHISQIPRTWPRSAVAHFLANGVADEKPRTGEAKLRRPFRWLIVRPGGVPAEVVSRKSSATPAGRVLCGENKPRPVDTARTPVLPSLGNDGER